MDRRTFVAGAMALLVAPLVVGAEQPERIFRIGILGNVRLTDPEGARLWGAFIQGLREVGYVEGRNITIEHRSSEGQYERLPDLAADLVRVKVDVIVAPATQNVVAAKHATRTIPIVMMGAPDPVGSGLIASLARPGGNVTGLSVLSPDSRETAGVAQGNRPQGLPGSCPLESDQYRPPTLVERGEGRSATVGDTAQNSRSARARGGRECVCGDDQGARERPPRPEGRNVRSSPNTDRGPRGEEPPAGDVLGEGWG